jgi:hypothetical protein
MTAGFPSGFTETGITLCPSAGWIPAITMPMTIATSRNQRMLGMRLRPRSAKAFRFDFA